MFVCLQICIGTITDEWLVKFVNTAEDDCPGDTNLIFYHVSIGHVVIIYSIAKALGLILSGH
jgi:hypothetical protein